MQFEIRDNTIITDTSVVLGITKLNNDISILTDAPIDSVVFLKIIGFKNEYIIPMYVEKTESNGHVFSCKIMFTNEQLDFINEHPKQVYECSFKINKSIISGSFKFTIFSTKFAYQNKNSLDVVQQLIAEFVQLKSMIYKLNKGQSQLPIATPDISKGMVPVATGINNEYIWDYPLSNVYNKLKSLSELVVELAEQNTQLANRLNELEVKLNEHLYEQYVI